MTDEAVQNALRTAIRNAVHLGRKAAGGSSRPAAPETEVLAIRYAESLVLPIVEARVEQALEDGFRSAGMVSAAALGVFVK